MSARIEGAAAIVTGGASGIGLATARALLAGGASVLVADVAAPPSDLPCPSVRADVRSAEHWERIVAEAAAVLGGVDLAFLNAGIASADSDIETASVEEIRRVLDVSIDGVILGTRAVVPAIAERGEGAIVATASLAGLLAFTPDPFYTAAKHAIVGFVRAVAPWLARRSITINAVCPGLVDTPILGDEQRRAIVEAGMPLLHPDDIAAAVLERFTGAETGEAWVCQAGRPPMKYAFRGVPGPAGGVRPPDSLAAGS